MHPVRHPRNVLFIGATFIGIAILYGLLAVPFGYHVELAGVTMLFALGIAMTLMAYVLVAGSSND